MMRIDLVQGRTTVNEDGVTEVDIILSRTGCLCAEGGERHTGEKVCKFF